MASSGIAYASYFSREAFPKRWFLSGALFFCTLFTTTVFGYAVHQSFQDNRALDLDYIVDSYSKLAHADLAVLNGLKFSAPLLFILLTHELGHYHQCRLRRVAASLPYFLPSPSLFGTFGAFIRIRSPIYSRAGLFDIGFSGPLAGFLVLLPLLVIGVVCSKVLRHPPAANTLQFGLPLALRFVEHMAFPGVNSELILLHPTALAAWAGLFATALNLLPIGQLDGGHLVYALGGETWHRRVTYFFLGALLFAGFFYWAWWAWAVLMFLFGRRHPLVFDAASLPRHYLLQFGAALFIFLVSLTVIPVRALP